MFKVDQIIFGEVSLVKVTLDTINFLSRHLETATETILLTLWISPASSRTI